MKIESIKVSNVRGLVDFSFEPKGKSVVVSGPNGSGKSALVDAIDFLFTGRISRLEGKGTGELSLQAHGPHVDKKPADAVVMAEVSIGDKKFKLERKMSPNKLTCTPKADEGSLEILEIAKRGYHVLSRKEILLFVATDSSTRAQQVQALLSLEHVEALRKVLVGADKDYEKEESIRSGEITAFEQNVGNILAVMPYTPSATLKSVNELRKILGGEPIIEKSLGQAKTGLAVPAASAASSVSEASVITDANQTQVTDGVRQTATEAERKLKTLITEAQDDPELKQALAHKTLLDIGLALIGDGTRCPLCEKEWTLDHLRNHLEARRKKAKRASEIQDSARALAGEVLLQITLISTALSRLEKSAETLKKPEIQAFVREWAERCMAWAQHLADPLSQYPAGETESAISDCFATPAGVEQLKALQAAAKVATPPASPAQTAWDSLTKFEVAWESLERAKHQHDTAKTQKIRCEALYAAFESAREQVLGGLYAEIENSFVEYYRLLHAHEAETFTANLKPDGAGLKFEVDFHGKGKFPPVALHSEGHQDSMGLCLYLALMSRLTEGKVGLTILDDVVMSVDSGHRRPVCDLLQQKFGDRQFIITTHDKMWARQLRGVGIVPGKNYLVFRDWTVETGPRWKEEDHWAEIQQLAGKDADVPKAAAALRRELEELFDDICDSLAAPVPFSGEGKYDLGDLGQGGISRLGKVLDKARKAAESWDQKDKVAEITAAEVAFGKGKKATNAEQWVVNETVHFNRWIQAVSADFTPVVKSFAALRDCFKCSACQTLLYVSPRRSSESLRCGCGNVNWNLNAKQ